MAQPFFFSLMYFIVHFNIPHKPFFYNVLNDNVFLNKKNVYSLIYIMKDNNF
jgi:hypothetical protein